MVSERIRWEPSKYHGWTGHTGTLESWVFQVWQSNSDHGDVVIGEWELMTQLPVAVPRGGLRHSHDPEALKAEAEDWLERLVASLGAVFPEKRTCGLCYGSGMDSTVNRNDCTACDGSGSVLFVSKPAKRAAATAAATKEDQ